MKKTNAASLLISSLVLAILACSLFPFTLPTNGDSITIELQASGGGELTLGKMKLSIPPGSLNADTKISVQRLSKPEALDPQSEISPVGDEYNIDIDVNNIAAALILEIPFDPARLPAAADPSQVFLSYYNEATSQWIFAGGKVDAARSVVILPITHASRWKPAVWNWDAWTAVLSKTLAGSLLDWVEAAQLLTDTCARTGSHVQVDESQAYNLIQACIQKDDAQQPQLRIVNPKSFFYEIRPSSGGSGYPAPQLLAPGDSISFAASTTDSSPLVISAEVTQKSGWYLVMHMLITMLPGANQFGIQNKSIACLTERLADVSYFASAVESLVLARSGSAAALNISDFMKDQNAVRRFITAADECNVGPAPTWSPAGFKQIAGAASTIQSATETITNYLAGHSQAQISFNWASPASQFPAIQIGNFASLFLNYDASLWQPDSPYAGETHKNQAGETTEVLNHKNYPGCVLRENLGRGAPDFWKMDASTRQIGNLTYRVEKWTNTQTGNPVLIVYQYPDNTEAIGQRIELAIESSPDACIKDAEAALVLSENHRK